jgi:NTE family protein
MVGAVSIQTGEYERYSPGDNGFLEAVLASTAIPLVWSPVSVPNKNINKEAEEMVDGGVRHVSPVGDVLGYDPTEVVIINCSPLTSPLPEKPIKNALDIGKYTMDLAMNEIFRTDIDQFLRINRLVKQAKDKGVKIVNNAGKEFKEFSHLLIEPEVPLGDSLEFFPQESKRRINLGWEAAKKACQ